jgi:hypothetical protein
MANVGLQEGAMSDLFNAMKTSDPGMADLYKQATGDRPRAKITKALAEKLFSYAFTDKRISDKEAGAFYYLLVWGNFDTDASAYLVAALLAQVTKIETHSPSSSLRTKIAYALSGAATSRIRFVGQYTQIAYSPEKYAVVAKLIENGKIDVWAAPSGSDNLLSRLGEGTASYKSDSDVMILPEWDYDYPPFYYFVVHEATHVIQDWLDKADLYVWQTETDAYLAGAVAMHQLKIQPLEVSTHPEHVAFDQVSRLLKNGAALMGEPFKKASAAVYKAVSQDINYLAKEKQKHFDPGMDKKRSQSEKEIFEGLYQQALKAAAGAKP